MFSVVPVIRSKRGAGSSCAEPWPVHTCYRPQRSCSKVMFLHLSVILFTGGSASSPGGVCHTPWVDLPGQTPPRWTPPHPVHAGIHTPAAQCMLGYTLPLPSACWDTVDKQVVRIQLECILVHYEVGNWTVGIQLKYLLFWVCKCKSTRD